MSFYRSRISLSSHSNVSIAIEDRGAFGRRSEDCECHILHDSHSLLAIGDRGAFGRRSDERQYTL